LANTGNSLFVWGLQIRRFSTISIFNSIIMGYPNGLLIDAGLGTPTDNNIPGSLLVQNTIIAGCPTPILYVASPTSPTGATTASITTWFNTAAYGNSILTNNTDVGLTAPFNYTAPDFNPSSASSPAATGSSFTNTKLTGFFTSVAYKGACAVGDTWWKTWTKF
jgi:hypothetical protein